MRRLWNSGRGLQCGMDFYGQRYHDGRECFFVDDSPANIEAGMGFGMKGCVYHQDIEELERNLKAAGILF